MKKKKQKGTITIFLCLLLSAIILVQATLYQVARQRAIEAEMTRALRLQVEHMLSRYHPNLHKCYGLYALTEHLPPTTVFDRCFSSAVDYSIELTHTDVLTADQLAVGIADYMQYRMPAYALGSVLAAISDLSERDLTGIKALSQAPSMDGAEMLDNFTREREATRSTIEQAIDMLQDVDTTGLVNDVLAFIDEKIAMEDALRDLQLPGADGTFAFWADPDQISDVWSLANDLSTVDVAGPIQKLMINEYALMQFNCQQKDRYVSGRKEKVCNLVGMPLSDLHKSQDLDLEYILTGYQHDMMAKAATNLFIYQFRLFVHLPVFLLDKDKKAKAYAIATALCAAIAIITAGRVEIKPDALKYLVLAIWAQARAIKDVNALIDGKKISVIGLKKLEQNRRLDQLLAMNYRDHVRLFLLLVPTDIKLKRMLNIFNRDYGLLYTAARAEINVSGRRYKWEASYHAYRETVS